MYYQMGKNLEDVQKINRGLVIKHFFKADVVSRTELAQLCGLKQATMTNIVNDLLEWGLIEETGLVTGKKGKRVIGLCMLKEKYKIISVRLSRNYLHITVFDLAGKAYEAYRFDHDSTEEMEKTVNKMISLLKELLEKYYCEKILGIGIAMPGPWVKEKKKIAYFTGFYKWQDVDVADRIEAELNVPVYIEQDANLALLAESEVLPTEKSRGTILCIMVGQGIGAGILNDGTILRGNLGIAGEIGHMSIQVNGAPCECGNFGCLEGFCSTKAVVKNVQAGIEAGGIPTCLNKKSKIADVIAAYHAEDMLAVRVVNESAKCLGFALASLTNIINPGMVIIGDEMSKAGEKYLEQIIAGVRERVMPIVFENTEIVLSKFVVDPAQQGVIHMVMNELMEEPISFSRAPAAAASGKG